MLVDSERNLLIFYRTQLNRKRSRNATEEVELVLVHIDSVESLTQKFFEFDYVTLLLLDCLLVFYESFERLDDAVLLCHN